MKKQRKHYTPEEKVAILRPHLLEGVPISDLCDELGLQPTVFYDYFAQQKSCSKSRVRNVCQKWVKRCHLLVHSQSDCCAKKFRLHQIGLDFLWQADCLRCTSPTSICTKILV
jgi:hypothetical protein